MIRLLFLSFAVVLAVPVTVLAQDVGPVPDFPVTIDDALNRFDKAASPDAAAAQPPKSVVLDVLELKDMDMIDVLKLISQKSGLNIVAGQNIRGKVTIYLKDVDVRDALKIILESNNLAYAEKDDIIRVMTAQEFEAKFGYKFGESVETKVVRLTHLNPSDALTVLDQMKSGIGKIIPDNNSHTLVLMDTPQKINDMVMLLNSIDVPIETHVFDLSYAEAQYMAEKIGEILTPGISRLEFDSRSNKIVVTDTAKKISQIRKVIEAFDQQEREVLIEARIVQIVLSEEYKMGVDWEAIVSDYHRLSLAGNFDALSQLDKGGQLSVGTISNDDYSVLLEALETVGETNILSSPRITTLNNKEARILVGSTEPYVTTTTTTPATGPTTTAESINFIDVGVKLYVTPTIHRDDYITMKIKPEVSSVVRTLVTSNNNTIPVVETSEAETTVRAKDGVTIVIGGLIKEEKIDSTRKIPLLGDLPLLGFAFRSQGQFDRKTELVIFLTPRIITGDMKKNGEVPEDIQVEVTP